jgi:hypothetical protein
MVIPLTHVALILKAKKNKRKTIVNDYIKMLQQANKKIVAMEKILALVKKDLLMRAEEDSDGCKVVDLSSSIWIKLNEALKESK